MLQQPGEKSAFTPLMQKWWEIVSHSHIKLPMKPLCKKKKKKSTCIYVYCVYLHKYMNIHRHLTLCCQWETCFILPPWLLLYHFHTAEFALSSAISAQRDDQDGETRIHLDQNWLLFELLCVCESKLFCYFARLPYRIFFFLKANIYFTFRKLRETWPKKQQLLVA